MIILTVTLLFIFIFLAVNNDRRGINLILRLVIAVIIALLASGIRFRRERRNNPLVSILLDRSLSMGIKDEYLRREKAEDILSSLLSKLGDYDAEVYHYAETVNKTGGKTAPMPLTEGSNIIRSLNTVYAQNLSENRKPVSMLIISDGADNSGMTAEEITPGLCPVYSIGVGNEKKLRDIVLTGLDYPSRVYTKMPFKVTVNYTAFNSGGREFRLVARRNGVIIKSDIIRINTVNTQASHTMEISPEWTGSSVINITVEAEGDIDSNKDNNTADMIINAARETFRVLYICGSPGWEYSFLRNLIKEDLKYDLVSFVILRRPENILLVPERDLSLIPFPMDVFRKDISEYDLCILENFEYRKYIPHENFEFLRKHIVDSGAALLMLGGENAFFRAGYSDTALEQILPVELMKEAETGTDFVKKETKFEPVNMSHPVIALGQSPQDTVKIWKDMPDLYGYNMFSSARRKEYVLGETDGKPVFLLNEAGLGKVAVLGVNTTWRWSFNSSLLTQSYYYSKFWKTLIRFLLNAQDFSRININQVQEKIFRAKTAEFILNFKGPDYLPYDHRKGDISVNIIYPSGRKKDISDTLKSVGGSDFGYSVSFMPETEGLHRLEAAVHRKDLKEIKKHIFNVSRSITEAMNPKTGFPLLQDISLKTGGKYFGSSPDYSELLKSINANTPEGEDRLREEEDHFDFSKSLAVLVILFLLFTTDLIIRKALGKI